MRDENGWLPLLARLLLAVLFFTASLAKIRAWDSNVDYIASRHLPFPAVLLAGALVVELATWIALATGFRARPVAAVAFIYMIAVTFIFHKLMSTDFQKNLGMMGGLLMVAVYGPGKFALFSRKDRAARGEARL